MYKIIPWSEDLDLTNFYADAERRGFENNANQKIMIDCFRKENAWAAWMLYYNGEAIGSVLSHSFPEMGENCYRIAVRTCVFSDKSHLPTARSLEHITKHKNCTAQFLIPACLEWVPKSSRVFITSNENSAGTQRRVHRTFAPYMEKQKVMARIQDMFYRGTHQTIWEFFPEQFFIELNKYPRWSCDKV